MIFSSAPNDFLNLKYSDELCHWGIKGQKWGIRRYQNPDGTLTEEGLKRYGYRLDNKKLNVSGLSDKKKRKLSGKQFRKDLYRLSGKEREILNDITKVREAEEKQKWGNNKEFKYDIKDAYKKYINYEKKGGYGPDYQDEILKPLYKKYPDAKDILDGISFWESSKDINKVFDNSKSFYEKGDDLYYYNWIDNVWNNDYYYEPNQSDIKTASTIAKIAEQKLTENYYTTFGKENVQKLWFGKGKSAYNENNIFINNKTGQRY